MSEFSQPLANSIKKARVQLGLTQSEVANSIDVDCRTVLNIENGKGNPKLEILYPLIRRLKIDPREIFYPETCNATPAHSKLELLMDMCTEQEAEQLIPIVESVLCVLRDNNAIPIE